MDFDTGDTEHKNFVHAMPRALLLTAIMRPS